jgi:hypothetical protein
VIFAILYGGANVLNIFLQPIVIREFAFHPRNTLIHTRGINAKAAARYGPPIALARLASDDIFDNRLLTELDRQAS